VGTAKWRRTHKIPSRRASCGLWQPRAPNNPKALGLSGTRPASRSAPSRCAHSASRPVLMGEAMKTEPPIGPSGRSRCRLLAGSRCNTSTLQHIRCGGEQAVGGRSTSTGPPPCGLRPQGVHDIGDELIDDGRAAIVAARGPRMRSRRGFAPRNASMRHVVGWNGRGRASSCRRRL